MVKVKIAKLPRQLISNEDIRQTILQMGQLNGGVKGIADRSNITYEALWGQLNRNAGVLAYTIARITKGTKNYSLIQQLCRACGGLFVPLEGPGDTKEAIESIIVNSVRDLGMSADEWKKACDPNSPGGKRLTGFEKKKIKQKIYETTTELLRWELRLDEE